MVKAGAMKDRNVIVLIARTHPGESVSSFVLKGFVERYLNLQDNKWAEYLRKNFVLVVVPMLNPDGVSVGNSRTSIAGTDLNAVWHNPDRFDHPEVYYTKKLIKSFKKDNNIVFFGDVHGNYLKTDAFIYGISKSGSKKTSVSREFGLCLSNYASIFNYSKSKYAAVT